MGATRAWMTFGPCTCKSKEEEVEQKVWFSNISHCGMGYFPDQKQRIYTVDVSTYCECSDCESYVVRRTRVGRPTPFPKKLWRL